MRVGVTPVKVPKTDVRAVRRRLRLSQSQLAAKFGYPEELGARTNAAGRTGARAVGGDRPSPRSIGGRPGRRGSSYPRRGAMNENADRIGNCNLSNPGPNGWLSLAAFAPTPSGRARAR